MVIREWKIVRTRAMTVIAVVAAYQISAYGIMRFVANIVFFTALTFVSSDASKKWTMPIRNWKMALNKFMIEFED